ncbi:MAG TPA: hypothetical protein VHX61_08670 [Rhizomicrobium sp.]|jgi:hypothetical protein|nr:hypothetical protein [Rhizomicrobium sp.]
MIARCWLHIGTGKTGITTIQHYLARNRNALLAQGYLYPVAPGRGNHHALTAYALEDRKVDETRKRLGLVDPGRLAAFRRDFPDALQVEAARSAASNLILSNEVLSVRLRTPAEVERIKSLCDRIAASTKVIVYLRNQVDFMVGIYTTSVTGGNAKDFELAWMRIADYAAMLARWSAVFGRENIIVRRYDKSCLQGGDVRSDFAQQLGLDASRLMVTRDLNRSLDTESIAFLRAFNARVPTALAEQIAPVRYAIAAVLGKRRGGTRFAIPRELAARIEDSFEESNAQVAMEYFSSLSGPLFPPPSCVGDGSNDVAPPGMFRMAATLVPMGIYWWLARWLRRAGDTWRPAGPSSR